MGIMAIDATDVQKAAEATETELAESAVETETQTFDDIGLSAGVLRAVHDAVIAPRPHPGTSDSVDPQGS
jgi:hypothetical protein